MATGAQGFAHDWTLDDPMAKCKARAQPKQSPGEPCAGTRVEVEFEEPVAWYAATVLERTEGAAESALLLALLTSDVLQMASSLCSTTMGASRRSRHTLETTYASCRLPSQPRRASNRRRRIAGASMTGQRRKREEGDEDYVTKQVARRIAGSGELKGHVCMIRQEMKDRVLAQGGREHAPT